jgi:hypothetical protein
MPVVPKSTEKKNSDPRTKVCSSCKQEKPRSEFYARTNRSSGLQSRCKECANGERWKNGRFKNDEHKRRVYAANKSSYQRNKAKYVEQTGRRNAKRKVEALEAYGQAVCTRCGFNAHPAALEFHHRDPLTKRFNIATAVTSPDKYPWSVILEEIAKCDLICSNCHRIEHSSRGYDGLWKREQ